MGRFWSLLFLTVPIFGVGIFVWAMAGWWPLAGHWLPENINAHGGVIDSLATHIAFERGAEKVIAVDPMSPEAAQAKAVIEQLKK